MKVPDGVRARHQFSFFGSIGLACAHALAQSFHPETCFPLGPAYLAVWEFQFIYIRALLPHVIAFRIDLRENLYCDMFRMTPTHMPTTTNIIIPIQVYVRIYMYFNICAYTYTCAYTYNLYAYTYTYTYT